MKKMIRDVLIVSAILVMTVSLFGMYLAPGWKARGRLFVEKPIHLVPTDEQSLNELDLCPLFVEQQEFAIDPELLAEMKNDFRAEGISPDDIEKQLAALRPVQGLKYHMFNEERLEFEEKIAPIDSPCVVSLGIFNAWNRSLIQFKSLDQFELSQKTSLSPALCAGHALNNARFIKSYAKTGEIKYLIYLHDLERSGNFLLDLGMNDWVNVEIVKKNIEKMKEHLAIDVLNISAVSCVSLFDSNFIKKPGFALVNPDEFNYVQELKQRIMNGLRRQNYVHVLIVGNEEFAQEHGHYFAFAIIKSGNTVQYVVLDTMPNVYHLQEGSHEKDRLMFIIQNIEQGESDIRLANIREAILRQRGAFN